MDLKFKSYIHLARLDKPIGIFLLLWPTLMALFIAGNGKPDSYVVMIFILGVIVMRSAGCVINDIADQEFDKLVLRTKSRPLAAEKITRREALILFLFLISIALVLVLQLNNYTIMLSTIGLALACFYPLMKRFTHLPQVVLGAAFGWAIPMAFAAVTESIPFYAWILFLANIFWTVAYDSLYAMVDREDDLLVGIKSTAILFGRYDRLIIGILQLCALTLFISLGGFLNYGIFYYIGIACASIFLIYQQYLIKEKVLTLCFKAFLNNNWFGLCILVGLLLDYYHQYQM